jgi:hypothetical protein
MAWLIVRLRPASTMTPTSATGAVDGNVST